MKSTIAAAALLGAVALASAPASASIQFAFSCISGTTPANCADGVQALAMNVAAAGTNQVDFTFRNLSARGSSITEIYFDDGTLLGIASVFDSGPGVTFSQIGTSAPPNLPGGNSLTPPFSVTAGFVVDTGSGGNTKGVENTLDLGGVIEFVTVRFDLLAGRSFADTLSALNGPLGDGLDLRVGLHVRGFTGGGSESFVNLPLVSPIPEPATWGGLIAGLLLLGTLGRRPRGG